MEKIETAILGGGCFWCTEAVFKMLKGVLSVEPGYAGGSKDNPTYVEVSSGESGHAEVIKIKFDPQRIRYEDLLTVFFASHDPTTLNRQGNDIGTEYRSVIFFTTAEQEKAARTFVEALNESSQLGEPIVTEIARLQKFFPAEDYHKDYYATHPGNPYCELVINPKLQKVQEKFAELLKVNEA